MSGGGTGKWVKAAAAERVADDGVRATEDEAAADADEAGGGKRRLRREAGSEAACGWTRNSSLSSFTFTTALCTSRVMDRYT